MTGLSLPSILYGVFIAAVLVTALVSCVLYYHWIRYGEGRTPVISMGVYTAGAIILLLSSLGTLAHL